MAPSDVKPELHGLAAGERPESADWTIPQDWESYSAEDHGVWKTLFERQTRLLPGHACDEFLAGMQNLPLSPHEIPDFRCLSDVLMTRTGWQVVAVPGLVPDEVFFEHLAHRRFPAGQFIRQPHELDYLQEPDVFHDVFGHVPMLMHPVMADFIQAYGQGGLRVYGSGIASSRTETVFSVDDPSPNRVGFDLERVMRTLYRIDDFQETYFVLEHIDDLLELAKIDFLAAYERAGSQDELQPGDVLATDRVLHRGTGAYHANKKGA